MNEILNYKNWYQQLWENSVAEHRNNQMHHFRHSQLNHFIKQGFPTKQDENWKYTDVSFLQNIPFQLVTNRNSEIDAELIKKQQLHDFHFLVFCDGYYIKELSNISNIDSGIILTNFAEAMEQHPEIIQNHWDNKTATSQRFAALNTAFATDGLFLYVPKGKTVTKPIHLLFFTTSKQQVAMHNYYNLIIAEEYSQVSLFEDYVSSTDEAHYFNNTVTKIFAATTSQVELYKCQNESHVAYHIANILVEQKANSRVNIFNFSLGSKLAREDLLVSETGQSSESNLYGLYFSKGKQHVDHHTRIDHEVSNGRSYELYKGILRDQATAVFNGKVVVHSGTKQTQAQLTNQNLLLSKTATINTKPELEIYAEDVKCTHGATVGQIDEAALFYLRARGIEEKAAIELITQAFATEVINFIKIPAIRKLITERLNWSM